MIKIVSLKVSFRSKGINMIIRDVSVDEQVGRSFLKAHVLEQSWDAEFQVHFVFILLVFLGI